MHDLGRALVAVGEFSTDEIIYKGSASSDVEGTVCFESTAPANYGSI